MECSLSGDGKVLRWEGGLLGVPVPIARFYQDGAFVFAYYHDRVPGRDGFLASPITAETGGRTAPRLNGSVREGRSIGALDHWWSGFRGTDGAAVYLPATPHLICEASVGYAVLTSSMEEDYNVRLLDHAGNVLWRIGENPFNVGFAKYSSIGIEDPEEKTLELGDGWQTIYVVDLHNGKFLSKHAG